MVTIKDVAKRANVAISTASYALNGVEKVSKATKEKVLKAAKELNYEKNGIASDLKRKSTKTIALILSDLSGPFYSELIRGVQDVVVDHGFDLVVCSAMGGENSTAAKYLTEHRADGCIVLAHNITDQVIERASNRDYPIVLLDRDVKGESTYHIEVDNFHGGYKATEYLVEQGHTKIGFVSGPFDSYDNQRRFKGFCEALKSHNIEFQSKWKVSGSFTRKGGELAANILVAQEDMPSAIVFANDEMAIGGIEAFKKKGISVPEDISIVGFDDILESQYITPGLTTIKQPKYEMGALATHLVFQVLNKERIESSYILPTELVIRGSVKGVKGQ